MDQSLLPKNVDTFVWYMKSRCEVNDREFSACLTSVARQIASQHYTTVHVFHPLAYMINSFVQLVGDQISVEEFFVMGDVSSKKPIIDSYSSSDSLSALFFLHHQYEQQSVPSQTLYVCDEIARSLFISRFHEDIFHQLEQAYKKCHSCIHVYLVLYVFLVFYSNSMTLSTTPPKGTVDWIPDEYRIRSYIFSTRKQVCERFGYQEYLTPLVEYADVYRAKSWEDVWWSELTLISDRWWRELAVRPEMTPSVTRMVSKYYTQRSKPIRLFSLANFYRNERPQRGRNREFRQLNIDIFGADSLLADVELLQLSLEIMLAFNPPKWSFVLSLNHRQLINTFLCDVVWLSDSEIVDAIRLMDKRNKLDREKFVWALHEQWLNNEQIEMIVTFMQTDSLSSLTTTFSQLADDESIHVLQQLLNRMDELGYGEYMKFSPWLMRGFDYYDGMVFEVFDTHPDNNRAMYGWGRYNGLASIFGADPFPAVGTAPWDETTKLFLESRWMLDSIPQQQPVVLCPVIGCMTVCCL